MASFATWYNHQYATWNRVRSLHQSPRVDTNTSRAATAAVRNNNMADTRVVVDMNALAAPASTAQAPAALGSTPKNDTLFGPNIGVLGAGPAWTERAEKSEDVLTPEIVKGWIAKSKETHYSTTTLQALVNLKRPTLRLSPLENDASEDAEHADSQHHHALEFEYDCDAPKCAIRVYVLLSPKHPLAGKVDASGYARTLVFETVTDGGFGKTLKFEDGAMLELGRFDHQRAATPTVDAPRVSSSADPEKTSPAEAPAGEPTQHRKKRFTNFHFRKRNQDRNVAGPALAVVDADAQVTESEEKGKDTKDEEIGVRVTIRLSALDEEGKDLPSPNEQVTYLHIVRFGASPTDGIDEEDKRPWVVKVVKREATIGMHTFHLHEIYGLSANSTTSTQPTAPPPTAQLDTHTYPPPTPPTNTADDEPSSECLLCLSSPREVVLLPCRHLVACRECAVNMIEFGAGGTIVQTDGEVNAPGADAAAPDGPGADGTEGATGAEGAPPVPAPVPTVMANPRRKRKAKGWFCPVCRQRESPLRIRAPHFPPCACALSGS
ncbi:hypothetical protein C8Q80DRAFT_1203747 [Daedaleopsis nitida]|nr:hypothetical protein C8Q80DRAFT_1203747 [Daedaleopsis nitida]